MCSIEMKQTSLNVTENRNQTSPTRTQPKPFFPSDIMACTLDRDAALVEQIDSERSYFLRCKICESECHLANNFVTDPASNILFALQTIPNSAASSNLDMNVAMGRDAIWKTDSMAYLDQSGIGRSKDIYFHVLETEEYDKSCPKNLKNSSVRKYSENNPARFNITTNANNDRKALGLNESLKLFNLHCESKCFQPHDEYQRNFKNRYPHYKDRSKTLAISSLKWLSNMYDNKSEVQKCHSLMSLSHYPPTVARCLSIDLKSIKKVDVSPNNNLHRTSVQSLRKMFGYTVASHGPQVTMKEGNTILGDQQSCVPTNRVKKKTSSTIQHIQEQLRLKMEKDDKKFNNSKPPKTCVLNEIKNHDSSEINNFPSTDRVQKQEKPYRQWHRVSRVVSADSKFIISPSLSHNIFHNPNNDCNSCQKGRLLAPEEKADVKINSFLSELTSTSKFCSDEFKTGHMEEKTEVLKNDKQENEFPVTRINGNIQNEIQSEMACGSKCSESDMVFGVMSPEGTQHGPNYTWEKWRNIRSGGTVTRGTESQKSDAFSEVVLSQLLTCCVTPSIPQQGALTLRGLYVIKDQTDDVLNNVCRSGGQKDGCSCVSSNAVDPVKPQNSISGVSQVTGPSFSEHKHRLNLGVPSKKIASKGPKLRTEERRRNNAKALVLIAGSLRACHDAHGQATFCKGFRRTAKNISKNSSRDCAHSSRSFSSERRHQDMTPDKPRVSTSPNVGHVTKNTHHGKDSLNFMNRNWSSGSVIAGEPQRESMATTFKPQKVVLGDVASKLLQKVSQAGLHLPWNESTKKYLDVQATRDYSGFLPGQLSFRKGQKIKQKYFVNGTSDGTSYGYYRVGRFRKKRKGLFPSNCVTALVVDSMDVEVSLSSSPSLPFNSDGH